MSTIYHESEARRNVREIDEEQARDGVLRELFGEWDEGSLPGRMETPEDWITTDLPVTFEDTVDDVLFEVASLIIERQRTYGPDNIRQQGIFGIVNRIGNDKLARIRQRLNGAIVNGDIRLNEIDLGSVDEPGIINDLADVIGYAVCGILLARGEWGRPLSEELER